MRRGAPARAAEKTLLSTRESIAACKKAAWMQQLEDIISGALELLPGSEGGRRDRSPAVYLLAGVMVCRSALTALYGTNTRTFGRKLALQRDEGTAGFLLPTHPGGGAGDLRRVVVDEFPHVRRRKDKGISGHCITEGLYRSLRLLWSAGSSYRPGNSLLPTARCVVTAAPPSQHADAYSLSCRSRLSPQIQIRRLPVNDRWRR